MKRSAKTGVARASLAKKALLLHPDMGVLSALQSEFSRRNVTSIVSRDLPTALLAITQHYFEIAVVSSKIAEEGDGWPVGGILRLIFPKASVIMIAPRTDLLTLRSAINNGIDEVCEATTSPEKIVAAVFKHESAAGSPTVVQ
jgi:ActR/RegA family two-component response regulator